MLGPIRPLSLAPRECCARSAQFWMLANTRTLLLAPFDKFLVPYWGFFSFLCVWDVAHLNCHPFLAIFTICTHFPSRMLNSPHYGDPEKAGVM